MDAVAAPGTTKQAPSRPPSLLGAFFAPTIVILAVIGSWATRGEPRKPLGTIGDFQLTDQSGRKFSRHELDGKTWVANFIFTECHGTCGPLSESMEKLQAKLAGTDARLVSFSVDPEHDTPARLADYATAHKATERWTFLTGDVGAMTTVVCGSFLQPMYRDKDAPPSMPVSHSSRLVLVDREGRIRGFYEPLDIENPQKIVEPELDRLSRDLRALGNASRLPLVNATLNASSGLLLVVGFALIRAGKTGAHAAAMLGALAVSAVFLGCYLYYHASYPNTPFAGEGTHRVLYFTILIPHVVLAIVTVPLAVGTAVLGLKGRFEPHRRWARRTFPLWIYVSVTGVAVYALLYEIHRP